ncbi:MAG: DUF433 domain-containing protein [Acidimicrobiaceae bacterium]|nr:DUF433 domain-containing protein [Acidimicrobiaceae bacterium]
MDHAGQRAPPAAHHRPARCVRGQADRPRPAHLVEMVLSLLAQGVATDDILDDYPDLEAEDVLACTAYAHAVIARDTLASVSVPGR